MHVSYEGIGQWAATFACEAAEAGTVVKVSGNGTVAACEAGENFDGIVVAVGRDQAACSVALGGMLTVSYTGTAPAVGRNELKADGSGGVSVASGGRSFLAVDVDTTAQTVTIVL